MQFKCYRYLKDTFGPKSKRKRVKLNQESLVEMMETVKDKDEHYDVRKDGKLDEHKVNIHVAYCDIEIRATQSTDW